jgi:hypothetical protein
VLLLSVYFFSILKAYWYEAQVTPQQLVHA